LKIRFNKKKDKKSTEYVIDWLVSLMLVWWVISYDWIWVDYDMLDGNDEIKLTVSDWIDWINENRREEKRKDENLEYLRKCQV
jgi:hypothetical protein